MYERVVTKYYYYNDVSRNNLSFVKMVCMNVSSTWVESHPCKTISGFEMINAYLCTIITCSEKSYTVIGINYPSNEWNCLDIYTHDLSEAITYLCRHNTIVKNLSPYNCIGIMVKHMTQENVLVYD